MPEGYSAVMQLGRHSDVMLLRDISSGKLVVRRVVDTERSKIYQTLQNIKDSHIPAIYSIAEVENGTIEILEEYIEGRTLEEMLQEKKMFSEADAVLYAIQLCEALAKIHHAGFVHRDIKPSNIIITPEKQLYLIDFDIARVYKNERNIDTEFLGTQGYAAPEQFGFRQTNAQTDIYSVGVLLNKMLTGKMPQEQLVKGAVAHIIRRCTEMDSFKRYQNIKALERALRPYLPEGHPKAFHFLRQIPGFRSFTAWKMAVAGTVYGFLLLCILVELPEIVSMGMGTVVYLAASGLYCIFLLFFLFDSFQIRSRIKWLEKSRRQIRYPLKCILFAVVVLTVTSFICTWISGILE